MRQQIFRDAISSALDAPVNESKGFVTTQFEVSAPLKRLGKQNFPRKNTKKSLINFPLKRKGFRKSSFKKSSPFAVKTGERLKERLKGSLKRSLKENIQKVPLRKPKGKEILRGVFNQTKDLDKDAEDYFGGCKKILDDSASLCDSLFKKHFGGSAKEKISQWEKENDSDLISIRREIKLESLSRKLKLKNGISTGSKSFVEKRLEGLFDVDECYEKKDVLGLIESGASWHDFLKRAESLCSASEIRTALSISTKEII